MPTEKQTGAVLTRTSRTLHCCLDVRGSLKTMSRRQLTGLFRHADGTKCTADEAKDHLLEALAQGKEVLRKKGTDLFSSRLLIQANPFDGSSQRSEAKINLSPFFSS
jgi:hypothetical protein